MTAPKSAFSAQNIMRIRFARPRRYLIEQMVAGTAIPPLRLPV
jgi:hypothetical protein